MKQTGRIILASSSPRRKDLLERQGLIVEVIPSEVSEVGYGEDPALVPARMTVQKVKAVRLELGPAFEGWIIAADTVVALDHEMFGKPEDRKQARAMLVKLSGKEHRVFTAYRIDRADGEFREETIETIVKMAPMSEAEIEWYVNTGETDDKAGAYAIQGKGGLFVQSISGSYSNVVGLPLYQVFQTLRSLGAITD